MNKLILAALALPSLAFAAQPAPTGSQLPIDEQAERLRDAALSDDLAWTILEGLTTEVGPRQAGTEAEARARSWAVRRLTELGFSNVRIEPFEMPVWVRGEERAEIVSPFPQPLVVTALGNSGATPQRGVEAEVIGFDSEAASEESVRGKIVFIDHGMAPTQDGSGYGQFGAPRRQGPSIASRKGAAAIVIRSIGTDYHRNPHTGVQMWAEGVRPIPAGALTVPDAEQLRRILARGRPVRMRLTLTPRNTGRHESGNVVAEVPGSDPSAGVITIGGHLDSWDLGTGALDNAAGVAITTAAAHRIMQAGRPRRTIRVVLFGAEEVGGGGGDTHFALHRENGNVVLVGESDFGADRIWRVDFNLAPENEALADRVAALLAPLGIVRGRDRANAGADLGAWPTSGTAAIDLNQDGTRYFDYHHTPDDTLDKVDPTQLRQNVAAWTAMLAVVANAPEAIGPVPAAP
ncbi:M20/M25/M40 family metallo-hydrolase [Sphingosinicella sp. CPCC 101087]|uniref:M20/M25/M40 family metallo-hydrolase n=1 Tax=Sphingosinicella sp. CPCC 101087 TaxID=2497754 RepID=UPI00101B8CDB|nr:M20/M25/M40 family metallo-hydrolase [Sphingosinicella sp. CPCC 101087]